MRSSFHRLFLQFLARKAFGACCQIGLSVTGLKCVFHRVNVHNACSRDSPRSMLLLNSVANANHCRALFCCARLHASRMKRYFAYLRRLGTDANGTRHIGRNQTHKGHRNVQGWHSPLFWLLLHKNTANWCLTPGRSEGLQCAAPLRASQSQILT